MKKIYTIGRDEGCDVIIPDNTDVISRVHATIRVESNDKIFLTDQSRNGTYVNGMKMSSNVEIPISREDVVSFAHIYNLDWSLVPKPKNYIKGILIAFFCVIVIAGITYAVISHFSKTNETPLPADPEPIEIPALLPEKEKPVTGDSVSEGAIETPKEQEKPKVKEKEKTDTVKVEKTQEEIYNPIY